MDLMTAFSVMLGDVTHVNASARQVHGILSWHDRTRGAVRHAARLAAGASCLEVRPVTAVTHRSWRASSRMILDALTAQAEEAARRRQAALREAASEDQQARQADAAAEDARRRADAARGRAAAAAAGAAAARAQAAGCADSQDAGAFLAQAASLEAEAAAAAAEAAAADREAAALEAAAARHRENARKARQLAAAMLAWEIAARDAHGTGTAVLAAEQPVARQMHDGIQAAGGLPEVPRDKRYLTLDGAAAARGGAGQ